MYYITQKKLTLHNVVCIINTQGGDNNQMKQKDFVKILEDGGFKFLRHGSNHDIYVRGNETEEVPRHKEINEKLAKAILRKRGLL